MGKGFVPGLYYVGLEHIIKADCNISMALRGFALTPTLGKCRTLALLSIPSLLAKCINDRIHSATEPGAHSKSNISSIDA